MLRCVCKLVRLKGGAGLQVAFCGNRPQIGVALQGLLRLGFEYAVNGVNALRLAGRRVDWLAAASRGIYYGDLAVFPFPSCAPLDPKCQRDDALFPRLVLRLFSWLGNSSRRH